MRVPQRALWTILGTVIVLAFGIVLNRWLTTSRQMLEALLIVEVFFGAALLVDTFLRARRNDTKPTPHDEIRSAAPMRPLSGGTILVFAIVLGAWFYLYREHWQSPQIMADDLHYLRDSADWDATRRHLFAPYNEHLVVPTRLLTYVVIRCSDGDSLATAMAVSTIGLFFGACVQLFLLAMREWQSEFAGLVALCLFAVTTTYRQVILWYSASQWLFALNLLMLSLLVAQRPMERLGGWRLICLCALGFAGPFMYSIGMLVGPLTSCWLAVRTSIRPRWRSIAVLAAPTLGTAVACVLVMPILANWLASADYSQAGGRGVFETFDPAGGVVAAAHFSVDLAITGMLGASLVLSRTDPWLTAALFPLLPIGLAVHCHFRPVAWRLWPLVVMIGVSYAATVCFRTYVDELLTWTRYQLFPQTAYALLLAGVIHQWRPAWLDSRDGRLTLRQAVVVMLLAIALERLHEGFPLSAI